MDHFGGPGAALVATATSVRFETVCGSISFPQALVPDVRGEFALSPVLIPVGIGGRAAVALRGSLAGDHLDVDLVALSGAADVRSTRYSLLRGQSADYGHWACAAGR